MTTNDVQLSFSFSQGGSFASLYLSELYFNPVCNISQILDSHGKRNMASMSDGVIRLYSDWDFGKTFVVPVF